MTPSNFNSTISDGAMSFVSILLGLISNQDWEQFEKQALAADPRKFKFISKFISEECGDLLGGMTLLHSVVRYDPPIELLVQMIELYPTALGACDCLGRTPLHVAAGSGASTNVMKILTVNCPGACSIQDEDGRTPLHFACDTSCELFEDDDRSSPRKPPTLDTIRCLLSGSLDAVTLEDVDETNAIEYAIISDASPEVVKLLQKASQKVMRRTSSKTACSQPSAFPASPMSRIRVQ